MKTTIRLKPKALTAVIDALHLCALSVANGGSTISHNSKDISTEYLTKLAAKIEEAGNAVEPVPFSKGMENKPSKADREEVERRGCIGRYIDMVAEGKHPTLFVFAETAMWCNDVMNWRYADGLPYTAAVLKRLYQEYRKHLTNVELVFVPDDIK